MTSSIMMFTLLGDAYIGDELVKEKTAVKLSLGEQVKVRASDKDAQVLFVSSTLLSEQLHGVDLLL